MTFPRKRTEARIRIIDATLLGFIAFMLLCLIPISIQNTRRGRSPDVQCLNNQKQVALGFLLWANDVGKAFPMEVAPEKGGTKGIQFQHDIVGNFLVISNELNTPKILACPSDKRRKPVETFTEVRLKNVSYFLNLTAGHTPMEEVVVGDRSLTLNGKPVRGYVETTNANAFRWTNWFHRYGGNVALADGSAHQSNDRFLGQFLTNRPPGPIRLLVP